jgi:hypothetical protein
VIDSTTIRPPSPNVAAVATVATVSKPGAEGRAAADADDDEVTAAEMQALYSQALPAFAQPLTIKKRKELPNPNAPQRKSRCHALSKGAFALDKMPN